MNALHLEDVQAIVARGCQTPGCTHKHHKLVVVARCHPKANVITVLNSLRGEIQIQCEKCDKMIVAIKIAMRPAPNGELEKEKV